MSPREFSALVWHFENDLEMRISLAGMQRKQSESMKLAKAFGAL